MDSIGPFTLNQIHQGDCISQMQKLPDNSIDLIFADPPYNLQLNSELYRPNQTLVDAVNDHWDQFDSLQEYDNFTRQWLTECRRILKPTGSIWVIGSYHNIFRVGTLLQNEGFWILNDIVWIKTNPMPNFKGTRFNNAHETMIWASKQKNARYTFHYHSMKVLNDDLQMRSDWLIPICQGEERIRVNGQKAHSTQKPQELLFRIILSTSNPGDIVLDPFSGSGTTAAVAKRLGRRFIGFEKEDFYIRISRDRIEKIDPLPEPLLEYKIEKRKPKVPFGNLIEKQLITPGEKLYSKDEKFTAEVMADGSLLANDIAASIHKTSARMLGRENNNGWSFWYVKRDKRLISIDELRHQYEKEYMEARPQEGSEDTA